MKYPFLDLAKVNEPYYDELVRAAERVIRSGRYIGGEEVEAFETELSQMLKAPYIIGVSNGLDALRLILRAYIQLGVFKEGDEVGHCLCPCHKRCRSGTGPCGYRRANT